MKADFAPPTRSESALTPLGSDLPPRGWGRFLALLDEPKTADAIGGGLGFLIVLFYYGTTL